MDEKISVLLTAADWKTVMEALTFTLTVTQKDSSIMHRFGMRDSEKMEKRIYNTAAVMVLVQAQIDV